MTDCQKLRQMNHYFGFLRPYWPSFIWAWPWPRGGQVENWFEKINGTWICRRALIDRQCGNEIISVIDDLRTVQPLTDQEVYESRHSAVVIPGAEAGVPYQVLANWREPTGDYWRPQPDKA